MADGNTIAAKQLTPALQAALDQVNALGARVSDVLDDESVGYSLVALAALMVQMMEAPDAPPLTRSMADTLIPLKLLIQDFLDHAHD